MKVFLLCTLLLLLSIQAASQDRPLGESEDVQRLIEQLFPVPANDLPYEDIYEVLLQYYTQPLDLNKATVEELQSLFVLSDEQIIQLQRHKERNGLLLSIYELQAIPGWDLTTIYRILPFVTVSEEPFLRSRKPLVRRILQDGQKMFLLRTERVLEQKAGFLPSADTLPPAYLGSANKVYARFRLNRPHDFSFGLTLEKDAGEPVEWNPRLKQYGADFFSFHAILYRQGNFSKIVVGDFQLQYGQSLVFGSGFSIGKGAETITTIRRNNTGLRPYTSVLETGFFRGAGFTYTLTPALELTTFYSSSRQDAILEQEVEDAFFGSLQQTGFHRTIREREAKDNIREQSAGGVLHYKSRNRRFQIGATTLYTHFSKPWQRKPRLYNFFEFNGQQNLTGSLFTEYSWQNFNLFSEVAISQSGGKGMVAGVLSSLLPVLDFSFLYRKYEKNFHSFYRTAFGEGSRPINEEGLYWGLKFQPKSYLWFSGYFDSFRFPWLRYRVNAPSGGYEYMLRANYQPSRQLLLYGQFREEVKAINSSGESTLRQPLPGTRRNYLLSLSFSPYDKLDLHSRLQWSSYALDENISNGYVLVQDASWKWGQVQLSGRVALFQTDNYETRQYVYEKDVLWAFSIPAYYGKGIRQYLLLRYKLHRQLSIWLRWSRTTYLDREQIGSGTEKIDGSMFQQLKAQIRWMF
ncbi:ComEA family DNA-binding protein [Nafulsella turpanensis]|uniref:ComEA family DNA-binding protein n=1 Tax=Nafulsella turpanensis TaxID=1265690 RepID=UPI00034A8C19|nr:helix-hairpin-helix domain-containing protein [Nafulsella turpanensis]